MKAESVHPSAFISQFFGSGGDEAPDRRSKNNSQAIKTRWTLILLTYAFDGTVE